MYKKNKVWLFDTKSFKYICI